MSGYLFAYAVMQIPAGMLSDRFGQKYIIIPGLLLTSLANAFVGLSSNFTHMIFWRLLAGLGAGTYFSTSTSLISDIFPVGKRGKAIGAIYSGIGVGTITAALLGSLIAELKGWRAIFPVFVAPGLTSAMLFWKLVKRAKQPVSESIGDSKTFHKDIFKNKSLISLIVMHFLVLVTYFSLATFVPTYLVTETELSLLFANITFIALPLFEIFAGPIGGAFADRIGKKRVVVIGLTTVALMASVFPIIKSPGLHFISLVILGFMIRAILTALSAFVADISPSSLVGTALGGYNAIGFLGSSIGPYIFGSLTDVYGFNTAFLFAGSMTGIAIPLIIMAEE
jgi:predicted MFS family arabinose efflux permease